MRGFWVRRMVVALAFWLTASGGGAVVAVGEDFSPAAGQVTVVWISIDGVRPDYVDRADTPTLDRLIAAGVHTRELVPAFPSVTFSSHVSQATGTTVRHHGVPGNSFYDARRRRIYRYPPFANMVQAEPIWFTATRQGVRTAVLDWPMAHWQRGELQTAYSKERFDGRLSDRERLEELVDTWRGDSHEQPLRFLLTWIGELDKAGHEHGPDAPEVAAVMAETDELLGWFVDAIHTHWQAAAGEGDELYLILTTDHGMSDVHTLVNPFYLTGIDRGREDVVVVSTGNISHIHVDQVEGQADREALLAQALAKAGERDFVRAWRREDVPAAWEYDHATRTGDVILVLDPGYAFSNRPRAVVGSVEEHGGPRGMHGYDAEDDANMLGFALFHRWPEPLGGRQLGAVHSLQLHPTVARLLGIQPGEKAGGEPVALEGE